MFYTFLYIFRKLCRIKFTKKDLPDIPVSLVVALIIGFIPDSVNFISPIVLLLLSMGYVLLKYRFGKYELITVSILSIGVSYFTLFASLIISSPLGLICYTFITNELLSRILSFIISGIFQIVCVLLLFRIKQLRSSLAPKKFSYTYELLVLASIITIFMAAACAIQPISTELLLTFFLFACTCSLVMYSFWRKHITHTYNSIVYNRNIDFLEKTIASQLEKTNSIIEENKSLSKLIHRDNKIIPAMEKLVREIARVYPVEETTSLLAHLEELASERKGILKDHQYVFSSFSKTDNISVNASIEFLQTSADEQNTKFTFISKGKISPITNIISTIELISIISDLGTNALIAVRDKEQSRVGITIDTDSNIPTLEFLDNGDLFDCNVLANFGKQRTSTHLNEGGSGIGLMALYEILQKAQASLVIDESYITPYSKAVRVLFDRKSSITIITGRKEVFDACKAREDIVIQNI